VRRGEIWWCKRRKKNKNCCVYTQQLKWLHKHDPLSFSIFLFFFFLCLITWQALLRPTRYKSYLQHLLAWLSGSSQIFFGPQGKNAALHYMVASSRSKALQLPYYRSGCAETIINQLRMLDMSVFARLGFRKAVLLRILGVSGCDVVSPAWCLPKIPKIKKLLDPFSTFHSHSNRQKGIQRLISCCT
jgi:hypothetical protein